MTKYARRIATYALLLAVGAADPWLGAFARAPIFETSGNATVPVAGNVGHAAPLRTEGEIAASVTPSEYAYAECDIRRYGASTDSSNNAAAINSALRVSASGGCAAYIPAGKWTYTTTLSATLNSSMRGEGSASVLNPTGVDGITFTNQPSYLGSRFFRDFFISGTDTGARSGIIGAMTAASGTRVTGVVFSGITIQNFGYGINIQGFWNTSWSNLFLYNNYQGIYLTERNIKNTFTDCSVIKGPMQGVRAQYGVLLDQVGGLRSEDTIFRGCYVYGYDYGIAVGNALYTVIDQCDIDNTQGTGIVLTTVNGGTTVRDSWINTNKNSLTKGIDVSALGSVQPDQIVLENNVISATLPFAGSIGVAVGHNQIAVVVASNRVTGFETALKNASARNFVARGNSLSATKNAVYVDSTSIDNEIGPNDVESGTALTFSGATPDGFAYHARGSFTITLSGMTRTVEGTVNYVADGHTVTLSVAGIRGTSNTAAMTGMGLPAVLWPVTDQSTIARTVDSGTNHFANARIAATGLITFFKGANDDPFTTSGIKGLGAGTITYSYQ